MNFATEASTKLNFAGLYEELHVPSEKPQGYESLRRGSEDGEYMEPVNVRRNMSAKEKVCLSHNKAHTQARTHSVVLRLKSGASEDVSLTDVFHVLEPKYSVGTEDCH